MLLDFIRSGNIQGVIVGFLVSVFVVFCTFPIHEYAHALVATKLGDETPRLTGRLTLNPMAHIDVMGALMILLVGFGYAKPVQVNARRFKNPKSGMALTALAGPAANIIMSLVFCILGNIVNLIYVKVGYGSGSYALFQAIYLFFSLAAQINASLAVFNLIPIPPLDGSKILALVIPPKYYFKYLRYERYIITVVFALIIFGILDGPLSFLSGSLLGAVKFIADIPFKLLG